MIQTGGTLNNAGAIRGGNGGTGSVAGLGGVGFIGTNITLNNTGTIAGGLSGTGVQALAMRLSGNNTITNIGTLTGGVDVTGGLTFDLATDQTLSQVISGSGFLTKIGVGRLTLTEANTYVGSTEVRNGTLRISNSFALGGGSGATFVRNGATLELFTTEPFITSSEALSVVGTGVDGGGVLRAVGGLAGLAGGVTLVGDSTFTSLANSTLSIQGAVLQGNGHNLTLNTEGGNINITSTINNLASLTKLGSGTATLFGTGSTITGRLNLNDGTLQLAGANAFSSSSVAVMRASTTLQIIASQVFGSLDGRGRLSIDSMMTDSSGVTLTIGSNGASTTLNGTITGRGNLVKDGGGTFTILGRGSLEGLTTVNRGTLQLGNGSENGTLGTGEIALARGATLGITARDFVTMSNVISGEGRVRVTGGGVVTLNSTGTFSGGTSISGGARVNVGATGALGTGTIALAGAELRGAADATLNNRLEFSARSASTISARSGTTLTLGGTWFTGGNNTINLGSGADTGTIALALGTGTANNPMIINIAGGTVRLQSLGGAGFIGAAGVLAPGGGLNVDGTFDLNGINGRATQLTGTGTITSGAGAATLTTRNFFANTTFAGVLRDGAGGALSLTHTTGILTLTGANTYTGATTVIGGQLIINGSLASGLSVDSGTLSGTGTIGGAVTINNGGNLAPGQSPGTLTMGALTLNTGSTTTFELGEAGVAGGLNNDLIRVTGGLTFNGGTINVVRGLGFTTGQYTLFEFGSFSGALGNMTLNPLGGGFLGNLALGTGTVLLNVAGAGDMVYWNGSTLTATGTLEGGNGTWDLTTGNFANAAGTVSGPWVGNGSLAVFGGTGGTVTIAAGTTVAPVGLNFLTDGYVIEAGDAASQLELTGPTGFDTAAGATAIIRVGISGAGSLTKTGVGQLTLAGINTYTGLTTISEGALRVELGGSLAGAVVNNRTFENAGTVNGLVTNNGLMLSSELLNGGLVNNAGATALLARMVNGGITNDGTITVIGDLVASGAFVQGATGVFDLDLYNATIGSLAGAGTVVLGGGTLSLGWDNSSTTFVGGITGLGNVTKAGTGTLILRGNNDFVGEFRIDNGTLLLATGGTIAGTVRNFSTFENVGTVGGLMNNFGTLNSGGALLGGLFNGVGAVANLTNVVQGTVFNQGIINLVNVTGIGAVTNNVGALFNLGGSDLTIGSLAGAGTVLLGGGNLSLGWDNSSTTFSGEITGSGNVSKAGSGTFTLTGNNSIGGEFRIDNGTLILAAGGTIAGTVRNFSTFENGGTVGGLMNNFGTLNSSGALLGGLFNGVGAVANLSNVVQGTVFNQGIINLVNVTGIGAVTNNVGALFNLGGFDLTIGSLAGAGTVSLGSGNLTFGQDNSSTTFGGEITGLGNVTKLGTGTFTLSGNNSFTGTFNVAEGTLSITSGGVLAGLAVNNATLLNAGALNGGVDNFGNFTSTGTINGGLDQFAGANAFVFGTLNGAINNAGTLIVNGNLVSNGLLTITDLGSVQVRAGTRWTGLSGIDNAGTAVPGMAIAGELETGGVVTNRLGAMLQIANTGMLTALNTQNFGTFVNNGTVNSAATNSGTLTNNGIWNGALTANRGGPINNSGTVNGNGQVNGGGTIRNLSGGVWNGNLGVLANGTLTNFGTINGTVTNAGILTSAGGIFGSLMNLTGGNASLFGVMSGPIINDGTITLIGITTGIGAVTQGSGGIFNLSGLNTSFGSLAGSGEVRLGSAVLTVGSNNASTIFSGVISGSGGLVKTGFGQLTLSGVNTYTGVTTINEGVIRVEVGGSLAGAVVNNQTLVNAGIINGLVTNNSLMLSADTLNGGLVNNAGATALLARTINGAVTNSGTIRAIGNFIASGAFTQNASGILNLDGYSASLGSLAGAGTVTLGSGLLMVGSNNSSTSFAGVISGSGGLTKVGTGTFTLTGVNIYTGLTSVNAGTLALAAGGVLAGPVRNAATFANAGTVNGLLTNLGTATNAGTINGDVRTEAGSTFTNQASGTVNGIGFSFGTLTNAGRWNGAFLVSGGGTITNNGVWSNNSNNSSAVFGGLFENFGSLTGLSVIVSGANAALTNRAGGTITLDSSSAISASSGAVVTNQGTITAFGSTETGGRIVNAAGANWNGNLFSTAFLTNAGTITGSVFNSGSFISTGTVNGSLTNALGGTAQLAGALNGDVANDGTITLTGITTGIGILSQGTTGVFNLGGFNTTIGVLSGGGQMNLGAATLTTGRNAVNSLFSGVIAGTGSLVKIGTGGLILTGNNAYMGGTTISGGMLQLGNGGTTGSIMGPVLNNGTLAFNRTDAVTFGNLVTGTGMLVQDGTGTTTLTAANTYSGGTLVRRGRLVGNTTSLQGVIQIDAPGALEFAQATAGTYAGSLQGAGRFDKTGAGLLTLIGNSSTFTGGSFVNGGELRVNGSLARSVVTVGSGATLSGTGVIGGLVAQSGSTIAPGTSPGTLTVNGNVSLQTGSTVQFEIGATGPTDRINATGTAALGGTAAFTNIGGTYAFNSQFVLVQADGGRTGTFAGTTGFNGFGILYRPELVYNGTQAILRLAANRLTNIVGNTSLTANQRSLAEGIDAAVAAGYNPQPLFNIYSLPTAQLPNAFDQLSGEVYASAAGVGIEQERLLREAVFVRLASVAQAGRDTPETASGVGVWGQFFGGWGNGDGDGNAASSDTDRTGFATGIDYGNANENGSWRIGLFGTRVQSDVTIAARGSVAEVEQSGGGAYASFNTGGFGVVVGGYLTDVDLRAFRTISLPGFGETNVGVTQGTARQAFAEVSYAIDAGGMTLRPFVAGSIGTFKLDALTETGGAAALTMREQQYDTGTVIGGFDAVVPVAKWLRLDGTLAGRAQLGDRDPQATLALAAAPQQGFAIRGVQLDELALAARLEAQFLLADRLSVSLGYTGLLGKAQTDHGARATVHVAF